MGLLVRNVEGRAALGVTAFALCVCARLGAVEPVASYLATVLQATVEFAVCCVS